MRTFPQVGTPFVPGAELGRRFYAEAVRPLLDAEFPGLPHAAAHLGEGSDVLGYDTAMSRDHGWGPAVTLFLPFEWGDVAMAASFGLLHIIFGYLIARRHGG